MYFIESISYSVTISIMNENSIYLKWIKITSSIFWCLQGTKLKNLREKCVKLPNFSQFFTQKVLITNILAIFLNILSIKIFRFLILIKYSNNSIFSPVNIRIKVNYRWGYFGQNFGRKNKNLRYRLTDFENLIFQKFI